MQFEVIILGCGAAIPTQRHAPTAQAINWQGRWFLFDAGEGVQTAIRKYGVPLQKIEAICISHMHGDHVLGLPGLIGSMSLFGRVKPLRIFGPSTLKNYVRETLKWTHTHAKFPILIEDCPEDATSTIETWGDNALVSIPVKHRVPAFGFALAHSPSQRNVRKDLVSEHGLTRTEILQLKAGNDVERINGEMLRVEKLCEPLKPGISYVFSGDTSPTDAISIVSKNADVLYHEATFLHELRMTAKSTGHTTAKQAGELAVKSDVQTLILGHLSSRYRDETKVLSEAATAHPNVHLANEGMKIRLTPGEKPQIRYLE